MLTYKKLAKDIGIIGLTELIIALKGLVIIPIITKLLGTENYGIWAQIIVTLSLVTPIATLGLPYTLVRFLAAEKNKKEIQDGIYSVLAIIFAVVLIISFGIFLFSSSISNFFGGEKILVKILAFVILFECLNLVFLNVFRAFQEMNKYSFFMIFQTIGEVGLIAVAVFLGYGLFGVILALLIIRSVNFLIMGTHIIKKIGAKIPNFSRIKEYLHFGLPTIPGNIFLWIVQSSDRYLINYFLGVLFVGYYAPAYTLGTIINLFVTPLGFVLPAVLSKLYDENKINKVKGYLRYSLKYFLMIGIPVVFGLSVLSKQLLIILSTAEIAEQGYLVVPPIALSILLWGVYAIFFQVIVLKKRTKIVGTIWLIAAFLNLGLNLILIPKFGILGAAITTLMAYAIAFIITCYYSSRDLKFDIDWKFILKSIFASILMVLFIIWLGPIGLAKTIIAIISSALLYGFLMLLFKGFNQQESNFFKGLIRKINV